MIKKEEISDVKLYIEKDVLEKHGIVTKREVQEELWKAFVLDNEARKGL